MKLTRAQISQFQEVIWTYYAQNGRVLPWRQPKRDGYFDFYQIWVSEVMLQQTQVNRVIPKYQEFLKRFPSVEALAQAELGDVLYVWQGLGYNRRAKFLWQAARVIRTQGLPTTFQELVALPGVGANTAGAIMAYAYNQAAVFVETNIRTVYIHHFTQDEEIVSDDFIRDLLGQTLDRQNPREFYWALMDYGSYLKMTVRNNSQSKHYSKQSAFHGSKRQVRGQVLKALHGGPMSLTRLQERIDDDRLENVLTELASEKMISFKNNAYFLG